MKSPLFKLIREYIKEELPKYKNRSAKTISTYAQSIKSYLQFISAKDKNLIDVSFDDFKKEHVYEYLSDQRAKGNSNHTINLRLSAIKSFLKFCASKDMLVVTIFQEVSEIKTRKTRSKVGSLKYLSVKQLNTIFNIPDTKTEKDRRDKFFMMFAYNTGGRVSELLSLQLKDVVISNAHKGVVLFSRTKGGVPRVVPIAEEFVPMVQSYIKNFHDTDDTDAPFFYIKHDKQKLAIKASTIDKMLKKHSRIAHAQDKSFPEVLHCHMFRHSLAMSMYKSGVPIEVIKEFLKSF